MKKQICILTKSYKHGGFCVAGVDVDTKEYIRLVNSDDPQSDEIHKEQMFIEGKPIECFDIIECDLVKKISNFCQTENWLVNSSVKPKFIKSLAVEDLTNIIKIENDDCFIFNTANVLMEDEISNIKRSLYAFRVQNLKIEATLYYLFDDTKCRYKCSFDYKNNHYENISLTDPIYRDMAHDGLILADSLVIASLPCLPFGDKFFYKFVAKIIPLDGQVASKMQIRSE